MLQIPTAWGGFSFGGERGIIFNDPIGENLADQITLSFVSLMSDFSFHPFSPQASLAQMSENKNPAVNCGSDLVCGERGIRTPGSVETDQRFSRPPH